MVVEHKRKRVSAPFVDASACRKNPDLVIEFLAYHLRNGSLGLALGAGASRHLNLPRWFQLVNVCSTRAKLPATFTVGSSADELCNRMEEIEAKYSPSGRPDKGRSSGYRSLVKQALYDGVKFDNILHGDLLISLGALLIGSKRGSITEVINFNFDDALEWYLFLHGYKVEAVSDFPFLRTNADVTIYHPHGFLPFHDNFTESDFLIFSQLSYDKKMGEAFEPWTELTKALLKLSGVDPTFGPIFDNVASALGKSRPTGVWMFRKGEDISKLDRLETRNFIVLEFDDHDQWPTFLLRVCQAAAT
jgi:hypothetical protein